RDAGGRAAVAEREEIGERGEVVLVRQMKDPNPHDGHEQAGERDPEIDGEEAQPLAARVADAAVVGPRARVDAERERGDPAMAGEARGDPAALGGLRHEEEET